MDAQDQLEDIPLERDPQADAPKAVLDRGAKAWRQVLVAFIVTFNSFGFLSAFGVLQAYYTASLHVSPSAVSWIGSIPVFLQAVLGTVSGQMVDAGYFYVSVTLGVALQVIGLYASSFASTHWHLILSLGLAYGLGLTFLYSPAMWLVAMHFDKKRGLALAISSTGAPIGGVIYSVLAQQLIQAIGVQAALREMGIFFVIGNAIVYAASSPPKLPKKANKEPLVDCSAFRQLDYSLFVVGSSLAHFAVWFIIYYASVVPLYAQTTLQLPGNTSANPLVILNACGVIGRLIIPYLSGRLLGEVPTLSVCCLCCASSAFIWLAITDLVGYEVFCAFYGVFWHALQGAFTEAAASITTDQGRLSTRTGMCFAIVSHTILLGAPVSGILIEASHGDYLAAQLFAGLAYGIGAVLIGAAWLIQKRRKRSEEAQGERER